MQDRWKTMIRIVSSLIVWWFLHCLLWYWILWLLRDILSTFTVFVFQKENEKAVDELRKFYSAQAAKHRENMEQAVNHKVQCAVSGLQPTDNLMILYQLKALLILLDFHWKQCYIQILVTDFLQCLELVSRVSSLKALR